MVDKVMDNITDWILGLFRDAIKSLLESMFSIMDNVTFYASEELGKSPELWNKGIYALIREISIQAIVPIAAIILTIVVCHDFISQFMDKSIRDMDLEVVAKMVFKLCLGIFLLNNVFDITMGIFAMGQKAVEITEYVILGEASWMNFDIYSVFEDQINDLSVGGMLVVLAEVLIIEIISLVSVIAVIVVTTSRMIEIYIYCSISPIPFSTFTNKEWGNVGQNFIKNLFALAFQAFAMMLCLGIYNGLINNVIVSNTESLQWTLALCAGISVVLVYILWKCGSISKSIFNAI